MLYEVITYNARSFKGENIRVFPISNWTEFDVWQYIERENLELPSIYYAHTRPVVRKAGGLLPVTEITPARPEDKVEHLQVRFRTVGVITSYSIHYTKLYEKIALQIAERIRTQVEASSFQWEGRIIPVTLSIGVAVAGGKDADGEALIRAADAALYQAKQSGRNRVAADAAQ